MIMSLMDVSEIVNYLDIGLTVAFFAVIAVLVLSFVIGLSKGWRYGTYRFLFFAIMVLVCFCTLKPLSFALGKLDLSQWVSSDTRIEFSFNVDGNAVMVDSAITSLEATGYNVISQVLKGLNVSMDPEALSLYATSLVESFLVLLLVLVEAILLAIFGSLLCFLLWHILFKRFTPKEKRKKKSLRLVSAFEEFAISFALLGMLITPLSSIANSVSSAFSSADGNSDSSLKAKGQEVTPEVYDAVKKVVDTYDNSLFSKTFFSWNKNADGKTLDVTFFDYIGAIGADDKAVVSFVSELSSLAEVATYAVKGGVLTEEGVNRASLVSFALSSYMPSALSALAGSSLVDTIAPYALAIATNLGSISSYLESETLLDFTRYDYGDTLQELASLYDAVLESDILPSFFDEDGNLLANASNVSDALLDHFDLFERIVCSFDKDQMALFDDLVKAALWVQIVSDYEKGDEASLLVKDFFPEFREDELRNESGILKKVPDALRNLSFKEDILPALQSLHCIVSEDERLLPALLDGAFAGSFDEEWVKSVLSIVLSNDNLSVLEHYIDGYVDETVPGEEGDPLLLDNALLQNAAPKLLAMAESLLSGALGLEGEEAVDLSSLIEEYKGSEEKASFLKDEAKSAFAILRPFAESDAGKEFLLNYDSMPGIYFSPLDGSFLGIKDELLDPLADGLGHMDDSKIAKAALPKALEGVFKKNEEKLQGILGEGFRLHFDESVPLGKSFSDLLVSFKESQDLITYILGSSSSLNGVHDAQRLLENLMSFKTRNGNSQLAALLLSVGSNPIFDEADHSNLRSILASFLSKMGFDGMKQTIDSVFDDGDFDLDENIYGLSSFMDALLEQKVLDRFARLGSEGIYALNGLSFERLFASLDVPLVNALVGPILDEKLASDPSFSSWFAYGEGKSLSFKGIKDWGSEGKALDALLNFALKVGDISNLNLLSGDPDCIESLLKAMAGSALFYDGDGNYLFPEYLSDKLIDSFVANPEVGAFFSNFDEATKSPLTGDALSSKESYRDFGRDVRSVASEERMVQEVSALGDALRVLSLVGSFDFLNSEPDFREFNVLYIRDLFDAFNGSAILRRVPLTHVYHSLFDYLKGVEDSFSYANPYYLYDEGRTDQDRALESRYIASLLETIVDPSFGVLDPSAGKIDSSRFDDMANFDPEYFVKPVLKNSCESRILNTSSDGSGRTAFKELLAKTLDTFSYYRKDGVHSGREIASHIVYDTLEGADWKKEIDAFTDVLADLNDLNISINGHFDFKKAYEDGFDGRMGEAKVRNLLEDISSSGLLSLGLAGKLESTLSTFGEEFGASSFDFSLANPYYGGKLDGYGTLAKEAYSERECATLSSLLRFGYALGGKTDFSSFAEGDVDNWTSLLAEMASSRVFNSVKDTKGETLFQNAMSFTLGNDILKDYFYSSQNPKDQHYAGEYGDASKKAAWLAKSLIPVLNDEKEAAAVDASSLIQGDSSLRSTLVKLLDKETRDAIEKSDFVSLSKSGKLESTLQSLNDCVWTRDIVPNMVAIAVKEGDFDMGGIEIRRANPFYQYAAKDFDASMDRDEIENLSKLIGLVNDGGAKDLLNDLSKFNGTDDLYQFRNILQVLNESRIFHLSGPSYALLDDDNALKDTEKDLSVFEQVMYRVYKESTLGEKAYNSVYDGKLYKNFEEKLCKEVSKISDDKWGEEIDALFINETKDGGFFCEAFDLGVIDASKGLAFEDGDLNFQNFSPESFKTLALALNRSEIGHEAVCYLTKDFLENTLGLKDYSVISKDFDAKDASILSSFPFPIESVSFDAGSSVSVSYWVDGKSVSVNKDDSTKANVFSFDGSSYDLPLASDVSIEGQFEKMTVAWSVDDYFLSQEDYGSHSIPALADFLKVIYDQDSHSYLNLSDNDQFVSFLKDGAKNGLVEMVGFLKTEKGFFDTGYGDDFIPSSDGEEPSFSANDALLSNLLQLKVKFSFHRQEIAVQTDLNKYLPNYRSESRLGSFKDLRRYIGNGEAAKKADLEWMGENLASILYYDAAYTEAKPFSFGSYTLPRLHVMNLLFSECDTNGVVGIDDYLSAKDDASLRFDSFEGSFKSRFAYNVYSEVRGYAQGKDYFYGLAKFPPKSTQTPSLRSQNNFEPSPFVLDESTFKRFVNDSGKLLKVSSLLSLSEDGAEMKVTAEEKQVIERYLLDFKDYGSEPTKDVAISYYQGLIYELMVNRSYYHGGISGVSEEVDYITVPFGDEGYFAKAGSAVIV